MIFMTRLRGYGAFLLILVLLAGVLCACAGKGDGTPYTEEHTHTFGHWYDAEPESEGAPVTLQVRYCKICHAEETRAKE